MPSSVAGSPAPAGVAQDAVAHRRGQVEALDHLDDAQRVLVVAEAAAEALAAGAVEHVLADVPERRVAEVVAEPDRLREVLVEPQRARHRARDLRRLERVGEPRAVVVALRRDEHLGLVLEPAERLAVHDPVAVALERRAQAAVLLGPLAVGRIGARGERRERLLLPRPDAGLEGGIDDGGAHAVHSDAPRGRARRREFAHAFGAARQPTGPQAQVRVVLERLEDRPLGLGERARRRVRRLGQRAAERADEEVVRVLAERERARLAGRADDAARGAGEADQVLALAAARAGGELRREAGRQQQLEPERERVAARRARRIGVEQRELVGEQVVDAAVRVAVVEHAARPRRRRARRRRARRRARAAADGRATVSALVTVSRSLRPW